MSDFFYATWKVGDQIIPGVANSGFKDGMLVSCDVPSEWKLPDLDFGKQHLTAFAVTKHEIALLPFLRAYCKETGEDFEKAEWRQRIAGISLSNFAKKFAEPNLEEAWRAKDTKVDIIDARGLNVIDDIYLSKDLIFEDVKTDLNAISSGSYTIGNAGADYLTFSAFEADWSSLTGTMTGTQITDVTETAQVTFNIDVNSNIVNITSDTDPAGDPTAGHTLTNNHTGFMFVTIFAGDYTFNLHSMKVKAAQNGAAATTALLRLTSNRGAGNTNNIYNLFIDGDGYNFNGLICDDDDFNVNNVSVRDCGYVGIGSAQATDNWLIENCLVEGCTTGLDLNNDNATVRNVACVDNTTDFLDIGNGTGSFCISEDATAANGNWSTGANCITGVTPATEYELDDTSSDYAAVQNGAVSADTSTDTPTIDTDLMDGVAWTNEIGPKSQLSAPPASGTIIPKIMNIMRMRRAA